MGACDVISFPRAGTLPCSGALYSSSKLLRRQAFGGGAVLRDRKIAVLDCTACAFYWFCFLAALGYQQGRLRGRWPAFLACTGMDSNSHVVKKNHRGI